jgi:3-oxoacyl-(acyl-carrier-protein) synthase
MYKINSAFANASADKVRQTCNADWSAEASAKADLLLNKLPLKLNMPLKRVVVTGIGAITPLGNNLQDYWNGLINGVSGADYITQFDASKFKTRFACELKNFDPLQYLEKKKRVRLTALCRQRWFRVTRL